MKATLVKFPYIVNTGDECKGYRPRTMEGHAILFEGEGRRVLFAAEDFYGKRGKFFAITGEEEDGRFTFDESVWDYIVPEGPITTVEELPFTEDEVRAALVMPEQQRAFKKMVARCSDYVKKK